MWRYERGAFHPEAFPLPEEARLVLVVNGTPWTALSYTPGEEAYLALGHLFLSGVLTGLEGVADWPMPRASSGSFLAPKRSRMIRRMRRISSGPKRMGS
jgi:formate dehydrogenase assembly factor FdhD